MPSPAWRRHKNTHQSVDLANQAGEVTREMRSESQRVVEAVTQFSVTATA